MNGAGVIYEKRAHTAGPLPGQLGVIEQLMAEWENALGKYQTIAQSSTELITNDAALADEARKLLEAEARATVALAKAQGYVQIPKARAKGQAQAQARGYVQMPKAQAQAKAKAKAKSSAKVKGKQMGPQAAGYAALPPNGFGLATPPPLQSLPWNPKFWQEYSIRQVLGEGAFGRVYKVQRKSDGKVFAAKVLSNWDEDTRDEVAALRALNGRCKVIQYYGAFLVPAPPGEQGQRGLILMEYVEGDDLVRWYEKQQLRGGPSARDLREILKDLLQQLACLHALGLAHRDIKLENTILTPKGRARLIDFGISCAVNDKLQMLQCGEADLAGTLVYLAPEILVDELRGYPANALLKSDIWSLGIMMYLLMTGEFLIQDATDFALAKAELDEEFFPQDPKLEDLVRKMLTLDPAKRPSAKQLLNMLSK